LKNYRVSEVEEGYWRQGRICTGAPSRNCKHPSFWRLHITKNKRCHLPYRSSCPEHWNRSFSFSEHRKTSEERAEDDSHAIRRAELECRGGEAVTSLCCDCRRRGRAEAAIDLIARRRRTRGCRSGTSASASRRRCSRGCGVVCLGAQRTARVILPTIADASVVAATGSRALVTPFLTGEEGHRQGVFRDIWLLIVPADAAILESVLYLFIEVKISPQIVYKRGRAAR
jgi:hypothetical protein